jgi:glycine/D-amino acid oxidase-like deaminating enzyme
MISPRILIIGGGIAGTTLAWLLHDRGLPFLIVDRDEPATSSKVAAGLLSPITGIRLTLSWRYETLYPEALAFYRDKEARLGLTFYREVPTALLLRDDKAVAFWQKRREQPEIMNYVQPTSGPLVNESVFDNPNGGFEIKHSGWLDTAAFLQASRQYFQQLGGWQTGDVGMDQFDREVIWQGQTFTQVVFCTGWEAAKHPWFDWVPFQSAQGTVLQISADIGSEARIVNRSCWVLPRGDGTLRVGPTYEWQFQEAYTASPAAVAGLETKLRELLKRPYQIQGSQTGVRPIIRGRQLLIGRHPTRAHLAFLNGLGSKGVLRAPWVARQLVEHLIESKPIEAELDLAGNF